MGWAWHWPTPLTKPLTETTDLNHCNPQGAEAMLPGPCIII